MIWNEGLLYIEPTEPASSKPVLDSLTQRITAAFRHARQCNSWCGLHECVCGALSTAHDYRLPNGEVTNSLCVHYVAHHRSEVPVDQLARIAAFTFGEVEPALEELQGPDLVLARVRALVKNRLGADRLNTWTRWGLDVESLSHGLRGGRLPGMQGFSPARGDSEVLLTLLCSIGPESLSCVETVVEQENGDVQEWGYRALRIPGWDRGLWVSPMLVLMQQSKGLERRTAAMNLRLLGTTAIAAVPTLLELAQREADDRAYQCDLSLALSGLGSMMGVSLLAQLPPRPGQVGICPYCHGSGDCYCKRKRMATASWESVRGRGGRLIAPGG